MKQQGEKRNKNKITLINNIISVLDGIVAICSSKTKSVSGLQLSLGAADYQTPEIIFVAQKKDAWRKWNELLEWKLREEVPIPT